MREIYENRGKPIEVDRNTPMGIINQSMRTLENYLNLLERGGAIDLRAAEILQRLMEDVKQEMIDTFSFIEDKIGKIRLITASPNNLGIGPGAKLDASLMDPVTYREAESRKIEQAVNEQAVCMTE